MPDVTAFDRQDLLHKLDQGIALHPKLFGARLRVLFVIDPSISLSTTGFGLGLVLDSLRSAPWWLRFGVDVARRSSVGTPTIVSSPGPYDVKYDAFRFTMPGFSLNDYDQVWFFGFNPGNDGNPSDSGINNAAQAPLSDPELALLATWMDAGGGVFATGDHHYLGASMCSRIPRVRTMRRWTNAQGVPPISGPTRLDTNQPANWAQATGAEFMPFGLQGDAVPQPVEIVPEPLWSSVPWARRYAPHPILCTPHGVVRTFPDHPHEGVVIDDAEVALDLPPGIAGWGGPEYPGGAGRPQPHVIAYGKTTHAQTNRVKGPVQPARFGLVSVYDGEAAGVGRVVCDSTWHHWFSENLVGFKAGNPDAYRLMQHYFRNVGVWLATPAQRSRMLMAATWGVVIGSGPMVFAPNLGWFELGGRALDVLGRTVSACLITEWAKVFFELERIHDFPIPDPCLSCPPHDLLERVVLGGIARGLVRVSHEQQTLEAQGQRVTPDAAVLVRNAAAGVREAQKELVHGLRDNGARIAELGELLEASAKNPELPDIDFGVRRIRLSLTALQCTDPYDPALAGDTVDVGLRVLVDRELVAGHVLGQLRIPEPDRRGILFRFDKVELTELEAWQGSHIEVVLAASDDATGRSTTSSDWRGSLTLDGDPESWSGLHRIGARATDPWRAWVQVDVG